MDGPSITWHHNCFLNAKYNLLLLLFAITFNPGVLNIITGRFDYGMLSVNLDLGGRSAVHIHFTGSFNTLEGLEREIHLLSCF